MTAKWSPKDPQDIRDYWIDFGTDQLDRRRNKSQPQPYPPINPPRWRRVAVASW